MKLTVGEVMTRGVTTLDPNVSLSEMDRILVAEGISGAPVVEDDELVGIVSHSDVIQMLCLEQKRAQQVSGFYTSPFPIAVPELSQLARDSREIADRMTRTRVREIMVTEPQTVSPGESVESAARLMWGEGLHRVPVVEGGALVGILSSMDLVRLIGDRGLAEA